MKMITKVGIANLAELTLIDSAQRFIYLPPHQNLALDYLEQFFGKHLRRANQ